MGNWQYDNADLERLSTIMPLHDIGFTVEEVEAYMRLLLEGDHTAAQWLRILLEKRSAALEEIHSKECQLQRLDYLRHEIRKTQGNKRDNANFAVLTALMLLCPLTACGGTGITLIVCFYSIISRNIKHRADPIRDLLCFQYWLEVSLSSLP